MVLEPIFKGAEYDHLPKYSTLQTSLQTLEVEAMRTGLDITFRQHLGDLREPPLRRSSHHKWRSCLMRTKTVPGSTSCTPGSTYRSGRRAHNLSNSEPCATAIEQVCAASCLNRSHATARTLPETNVYRLPRWMEELLCNIRILHKAQHAGTARLPFAAMVSLHETKKRGLTGR